MKWKKKELHGTVREGYQILLRAQAELMLPVDRERMRRFYWDLGQACMSWIREVHGERLQRSFRELESVREKSRFHAGRYRFRMSVPWECPPYVAVVCESELTGELVGPQGGYRRISGVWNCEEELLLPVRQILQLTGCRLSGAAFPFRPDGVYPQGRELVAFRNATARTPWEELHLPLPADVADGGVRE